MTDRLIELDWMDQTKLCGLAEALEKLTRYCEEEAKKYASDGNYPEMQHDLQGAARAYRLAAARLEEVLIETGVKGK